ncbi:hypothetical protein EDC01DRAFT_745177 [Geopyxis carbonaria]|nr:hypothetical protein EDC01DRAFT_745177 [Geopyxis carbonaria]
MPGGQNSWVDSLSEDWISQPASSSPSVAGTIDSLLSGTRSSRALNERSTTNSIPTGRRHSITSESECGTMAVRKGAGENNDEWKRHVLGDSSTNDLFSKMPLENLFNPPTIGPSSTPLLQHQQAKETPTPPKSRRSFLPVPSALSTLPEEAGGSNLTAVDGSRPRATPRSDSDPIFQKSRLKSLLSRPSGHRRASSAAPDLGMDKKGKRKVEKYADIDHDTRSKIILPETERVLPKPKPRILRPSGRWSKGHGRSSSDDVKKNEIISPVSVGGLGLLGDLTDPASSDTQDLEEDDMLGDLPSGGDTRSATKFLQEPESSVYPSSPPIMGNYRSKSADGNSQDEEYEDEYLDDTKATLGSPFTSPTKALVAKSSGLPSVSLNSDGGSLIKKIHQHVDAPRSPIKGSEPAGGDQASSDSEDDPFFTPHPFPHQSEDPSTSPPSQDPRHSSNDSSKTPMRLFHSSYDTYTAGKLDMRLDEMEKSNVNIELPTDDYPSSDNASEADRSFSGGSMIVNRLEAMARKSEKENSPSKVHVRYQNYEKKTTEEITTVSFQRYSSAPSASPGRTSTTRKHRRWMSDESFTAINDGISAPISPLRDRTPKRLRRSISGAKDFLTLSPASRIEPLCRESPRRREHIRTVPEEGSILAKSLLRSRASTMESTKSIENLMGRKGSPTPTPRRKKLPVLKNGNRDMPLPAIGSPRKRDAKDKDGCNKRILFSGTHGDGMSGEDFDMPEPMQDKSIDKSLDDDIRKSSFTTDYFLQQAEDVMHSLRMREMESTIHEDPENDGDVLGDLSYGSVLPKNQDSKNTSILPETGTSRSNKNHIDDSIITRTAEMFEACTITAKHSQTAQENEKGTERVFSTNSQSSQSTRRISMGPEILQHHLSAKGINEMKFDDKELRWISDGKELGEEDPFMGISDLSINSREEEKALRMAREQWPVLPVGGTLGVESGLWRSSRVMYDDELDRLSSSVGSGSQRTLDSGFDLAARTETRVSSYGTDPTENSAQKETDIEPQRPGEPEEPEEEQENVDDTPRLPKRFADDFSSSPIKDDQGVDGFLEHGSLRQRDGSSKVHSAFRSSSARRRSGKSFFGRPVSKISEEDETPEGKSLHPDILSELRRLSLNTSALTPLPTPFKTQLSVQPPSTKRKSEVSFHLTPLRDLSYQFETTEALISLELNYISSRRGHKATSKAIEASFSIAQTNLIKHITDVEPYNPYWEYIKSIELSNRKIETLHTLNEWCPRLTELNVSHNELGQLSGVPETILNLKVPKNCLTDATFFGHLVNLQHLDVSGNRLEGLDALKACIHLRELKADDNQLTSISGIFGLEGLKVLRCRRNKIQSVDFRKSGLNRLVEIDLRGNQLTEIVGLQTLPSLVHVNFDQNQLQSLSIPPGTKLPSIRSIKLTQNEFVNFDVSPFPNLRVLYMDNNKLSSVNGMTRAKNIDAISFRDQDTEGGDFTLDINRMFEARKIYLSSNAIISLDIHVPFFNLQYLEIASCQLRSLPENFSRLFPNLRVLNINYNRIADIRPVIGCSRLEKFLAVGNAVSKMKVFRRVLEKLRVLRFFDLRMNPLTLEFYPTPMQNSDKSLGPDEYTKDPFALDLADDMKDKQFHGRMDMEGRVRRRHYEIVASSAAERLRELDGLKFSHELVNKHDDVFRELINLGWVEEPEYTSQPSDQSEDDEETQEDDDEVDEQEESFVPEA